jgi:Na+/proline symporter
MLGNVDWAIILSFFSVSLCIGLLSTRKAGKNRDAFFLAGKNMPWWLLGISMVATTFAPDTPALVTDIVRQNGVAGNWVWWAFLLTGMLTVFIYARLWQRAGILTDLEFYELRYSGRPAAFLRAFRAVYLGACFNIVVIATVSLALVKICAVVLDWTPVQVLVTASILTVIYSALGGLRGILITDFFQFIVAMGGSLAAAIYIVRHPMVGGLGKLMAAEGIPGKLSLLPNFFDTHDVITLLILPLTVQWWSVWHPGSEPGGGGYVAQRILSARNEHQAMSATLLFNVAHYALRPWPWILIALASLVVFPDLDALRTAFPNVSPGIIRHDFAYPAMLTLLPAGLTGLVVASLFAAYMSTVSTQLNWGASYLVHDFYYRFVNPDASEKQLVFAGRFTTVWLMAIAAVIALTLENALNAFNVLLKIGAGTGLIFILRWFWWRINAFSEIAAMAASFLIALYFEFLHGRLGLVPVPFALQLILEVGLTTLVWVAVTFLTRPTDASVLRRFVERINPGGPGWDVVVPQPAFPKGHRPVQVRYGVVCMFLGCCVVYAILFTIGSVLYGETLVTIPLAIVAATATFSLVRIWRWMETRHLDTLRED